MYPWGSFLIGQRGNRSQATSHKSKVSKWHPLSPNDPVVRYSEVLLPLVLVNVVQHGFVLVYFQEVLKLSIQDDCDVVTWWDTKVQHDL